MGQIHAYLLMEENPVCMEDMMAALNMSRGNVSINVRELIDWGIVHKRAFPGERRDFYEAERNMQRVALAIAKERKKRELDPVIHMIRELSNVKGHPKSKEMQRFKQTLHSIKDMAEKADLMISALSVLESSRWLTWMKKQGK